MTMPDQLWAVTTVIALLGGGTMIGIFRNMNAGFGPQNIRAVAIVLVATIAGLLATLDAGSRSAAIGILGAIAGYVFGKSDRTAAQSKQSASKPI